MLKDLKYIIVLSTENHLNCSSS